LKTDIKPIIEKLRYVKLLVSDIDGVLTNGQIMVTYNKEIRMWNVKDIVGYEEIAKISNKIKTAWITGRQSILIEQQAKKLRINYLIQNCKNKKMVLQKILKTNSLNTSEVVYVGDDLIDISVLKMVGVAICPYDACSEVKKYSSYISLKKGGDGVIREVIELIMKAQNLWIKSINSYISM
jgi:3-deoxy-D-manno-octulosonate 8-phosphate phosphatase (KDO 8-P phosphatase)